MRLRWIDRFRGIAILAVIWHHYGAAGFKPGFWLEAFGPLGFPAVWLRCGWMGVNLFFILSGFVLYLPYANGTRRLDEWSDAAAFLRHRAGRLLPLYYFSSAVLFVFNFHPASAREGITQFFALTTVTFGFYAPTLMPATNWLLWSLSVEIWFTFVFVAMVYLIARFSLWVVALVTFAAVLTFRFSPLLTHVAPLIADGLPLKLDDFLAGMILAVWYARGARPIIPGEKSAWIAIPAGVLLATAAAVVSDGWLWRLQPTLLQLGILLILTSLLSRREQVMTAGRWFIVELFGLMCYSIYIWHGVTMVKLNEYVRFISDHFHGVSYHLLYLTVYLCILAPIAWMSYRYIEFGSVKDWRKLLPSPTVAEPVVLQKASPLQGGAAS